MSPFPIESLTREGDSWSVEVGIPATCAAFRGHFPSRPVLPAIAQFQLLEEVVGHCLGSEVALEAVPAVRLRRRIEPDDVVNVRLDRLEDHEGSFRFTLSVNAVRATSGLVKVRPR